MRILDSYIDTYEKRKNLVFIIIVLCSLNFSLIHILLGIKLLPIQSYDDVLSLVDQSVVQQAYFGRNALELLNIQVLDLTSYFFHLFELKIFEWLYFVGHCICLFTSKSKYGYLNLWTFILVYLFLILMFIFAVYSGSLYDVMNYIRIIGIGMILAYSISLIVQIKEFIIAIKYYIESLKVQVVIVD